MTDTFRLLLGTILCLFRPRRSLPLENLAFRQFAQARAILEELAKQHPGDTSIGKLRGLVEQGESELKKQERLVQELEGLRTLVRAERYAEVVAQGEPL